MPPDPEETGRSGAVCSSIAGVSNLAENSVEGRSLNPTMREQRKQVFERDDFQRRDVADGGVLLSAPASERFHFSTEQGALVRISHPLSGSRGPAQNRLSGAIAALLPHGRRPESGCFA